MSESVGIAASYGEARDRFLAAAAACSARVTTTEHPTKRGPAGESLAVDVAEFGPADAATALLVVSGTHGIEGFAGSALQSRWLEQQSVDLADLRVVLVHALNPFGFAWQRRTNEDNVDLNRNFIDWTKPPPTNDAYDEIAELIVPTSWDVETRARTEEALFALVNKRGFETLVQTVTGGQYKHSAGVFYGGAEPVWSHQWLAGALPELFATTQRLGVIDVHTGLGPHGFGELIVHAAPGDASWERTQHWWSDVTSMTTGASVSAVLSGDWLGVLDDLLPSVEVTAAALEFGTIDPISVIQALRAEAWLHGHGDAASDLGEQIRASVRAAFVDDDPSWLVLLNERFDQVFAQASRQLST